MTDKEKEAKIVEVPTQTISVIELPDGRRISDIALLVEIYNELQVIKKKL